MQYIKTFLYLVQKFRLKHYFFRNYFNFLFLFFKQPRDYHFDYIVSDPHTGDHKSQWEVKEKGVVRGAYSLVEPDGTTRVVEYIADEHGFRAVVKKLGTPIHPSHDDLVQPVAPLIATPVPAPAPEPIIVPEPQPQPQPQPVLYDGHESYNGHFQNYVPSLGDYPAAPAPIEVPKVFYQPYEPAASPHYQEAPFFPVQRQIGENAEYYGFTGNDDDDSAYTKYGQEDGGEREDGGFDRGYSFEESRPQAVSVPFKLAPGYQQQPIVYILQQKY